MRRRSSSAALSAAWPKARSCERFELLANALRGVDEDLARLYGGLLACEARHHEVYVELAAQLSPEDTVRDRLELLAVREAEILAEVPPLARMHA